MSKIIFLDIDGVLNCWNTTRFIEHYYFVDTRKVLRLKDIVARTDAEIVLISSWRDGASKNASFTDKLLYEELVDEFRRLRCPLWVDMTPNIPVVNREVEIQTWLSQHPEVENYVILDDYWQELLSLKDHLVICDEARGLEKKEAELAINMLNRSDLSLCQI